MWQKATSKPISLPRDEYYMAGTTKNAVTRDADEAALQEFEAGLARSISQYKAG